MRPLLTLLFYFVLAGCSFASAPGRSEFIHMTLKTLIAFNSLSYSLLGLIHMSAWLVIHVSVDAVSTGER